MVSARFWLRPATVTGLFALILMGTLAVLYWRVPTSSLTVAELLQRATVIENADASRVDQILHRTISLEEKSITGELIKQQKVEVWQNAEKGKRRSSSSTGMVLAIAVEETEKLKGQFRSEFFNLFNHPNFANPINNLINPDYGADSGYHSSARTTRQALKTR